MTDENKSEKKEEHELEEEETSSATDWLELMSWATSESGGVGGVELQKWLFAKLKSELLFAADDSSVRWSRSAIDPVAADYEMSFFIGFSAVCSNCASHNDAEALRIGTRLYLLQASQTPVDSPHYKKWQQHLAAIKSVECAQQMGMCIRFGGPRVPATKTADSTNA